jgi:membrane protein DedA with SNARE-associated domain
MDALLGFLLSYVLIYKYVAIFLVVYFSALILPLPANAMLLAVGAFASQGYLSVWVSLAVAAVANTLGDLTGYGITRKYGEAVIRKLRMSRVNVFGYLREELREDAAVTVFTTRFAGSLSTASNFLAGLVGVPFLTFFFFDLVGNIIEPAIALGLGYLVGDYWSDLPEFMGLIAGMVAVGVVLFILARIYRRTMKKRSGGEG